MGSWRDGRIDSGINFRRHKSGPEELGPALADRRFEIQCEEGVKDIEGEEGCQQEAFDGIGLVLIDMVGMPGIGQFVEAVIFDIPSLVAEGNGLRGGYEMERSVVTQIQSLMSGSFLPSSCRFTECVSRERMTRTGVLT